MWSNMVDEFSGSSRELEWGIEVFHRRWFDFVVVGCQGSGKQGGLGLAA